MTRACCPKCKSANINLRSKRVFLIRFGICLIVFYIGYWFYNGILKETDVDGVVIVGVYSGLVTMAISAVMSTIWIVWAIITTKPAYKCMYCKNIFESPVFLPRPNNEDKLQSIKK